MRPKCKVPEKYKKTFGLLLDIMLALLLIYAAYYLLRMGTIHYRRKSQFALGLLAVLPLLFRPRQRATGPELLLHDALVLLSGTSFALLLTEYVVKGGIIIGNVQIWQGYVYHAAIFGLVYVFVGSIRLTACIGMGLSMLYALVDHYVTVFRGTPVLFSDLFAIGTAKNVAANYSVPLERSVLITLVVAVAFCVAVCRIKRSPTPRRWQFVGCSLLLCLWYGGLKLAGNSFGFWQGNLEYSEWYYFCRTAGNAIVEQPAGYSEQTLGEIAAQYPGEQGTVQPNLIVVMNESFADLRDVGDFQTNADYMPYLRSLAGQDNTITGDLYVSTFGGGTATTEFEVLTGDTTAFLPYGSSPYQMYVKNALPALISGLAEQGYYTTSLHPYRATSWNRQQVYERFGITAQYYEDDFTNDAERVRSYISDSESYRKIIEIYENKPEGQPFFMFNVTMQNHGGYIPDDTDNFEQSIHLMGDLEGKFPEVDEYLSLVKRSDEALSELIGYFSAVDEPTAIIFFGDHQPNVPSAFFDTLLSNAGTETGIARTEKKMVTPFLIWANYDIEGQHDVKLSTSYLMSYALDALGCSTSGYDQLRLAVQQQVPLLNRNGCQLPDGSWQDPATVELDVLSEYRLVQYAHLFDAKKRIDSWYEP